MNATADRRPWRRVALSAADRVLLSAVVFAGCALVVWLDSPASGLALQPSTPIRTAAFFTAIVTGIEILAGWVATAAEVTAAYVWVALQWLSSVTLTFLKSTGAMFAKVWDGLKIVWSDVLKPALTWIDEHLKRLYTWLKDTFKPVFSFLDDIRKRLNAFYTTFVRPVIDTIEYLRQINRVLLAFHIHLLQQLDSILQQLERRIEEPILWLNAQLSKVVNALELVVTADGFFQRLTLIRSMSRYAPAWLRIAANARSRPLTSDEQETLQRGGESQSIADLATDLATHFDGGASDVGETIDALAAGFVADWE